MLYTLAGTGPSEIRLLDLMGRAIGAPHPLQGSGQGELLLATPALRPGMVVVQLTQGDARASHKLIIPQ